MPERLDMPEPLDMKVVARANADLISKLDEHEVTVAYDEDADTMWITIGDPVPCLSEQVTDDFYIDIEPESLRIVGVTITQFVNRWMKNNEFVREEFGEKFARMRAGGGVAVVKGEEARNFAPLIAAAVG